MPTVPAVQYVPEDPGILKTLSRFADAIQETVNFGTHVLEWELTSTLGGDENAPITLSTRHILELLDSVSINIRNSSVDPCKLLLRGALESFFGVAYMLEADTERRSMAFLAAYANQQLKLYRRLDASSEPGKEFENLVKKDRVAGGMKFTFPPQLVESSILNLENLLRKPKYKEANAEYQRLKKGRSGTPYWFSLYGGPKNIEKLAEHLDLSALYHLLYKQWSNAVHGMDIIQGKIASRPDGKAALLQFRLPTDAQAMTSLAIAIGLELYQTAIKYYVPDRLNDFRSWYTLEIHPVYVRISGDKIIQVEL